ncbi:MAG TPA: hypothetical protein VNN08_02295 [Thermoanaerobaculia bacterium]|nr:hypothetical protein [Thermoanaerobaculia bacterium]
MSRRTPAVSEVLPSRVPPTGKDAGSDPTARTTTASKLVIKADPVFQPPSAAAELPPLDSTRPRRRRRVGK